MKAIDVEKYEVEAVYYPDRIALGRGVHCDGSVFDGQFEERSGENLSFSPNEDGTIMVMLETDVWVDFAPDQVLVPAGTENTEYSTLDDPGARKA